MKILMLTDRLALGGAETHLLTLASGLLSRGIHVEVASAGGPYMARFLEIGIHHHTLPLADKAPHRLWAAMRQLDRLLQTGNYDLVHAHARLPAFLADICCKKQGVPWISTAHWVFRADGWRGSMSRWGMHTLAVSEDIREYLIKVYGLAPQQISLTKNGIDTDLFCPCEPRVPRGRLIHISRLDEGRSAAAAALIRIAPRLAEAGCTSLTVVGDGNRFVPLQAAADEANRQIGYQLIHMTGGRTDVAPLLRESDIFIGVSRAALEAMACGLPTVLAGDEGYLAIMTERSRAQAQAGNFCCRGSHPIKDAQLLSDLCRLLADHALQTELGRENAEYVRNAYSADSMVSDAIQVYHRVLAAYRKQPPYIICGYYGFDNAGDEAVLTSMLTWLRSEGISDITVLSAMPKQTAATHRTHAVTRLSTTAIRRAGRRGGVFVLGGGNLLQDETSHRSLLYYTQRLHIAKRCGCRILIVGGIGRLSAKGEKAAARAIHCADGCLARTPHDVAFFRKLAGGKTPVHLLPDGALWIKPSPHVPSNLPSGRLLMLALHGGTVPALQERLTAVCADLSHRHGLTVCTVAMHRRQDMTAANQAAQITGGCVLPPLSNEDLIALMKERGALVISTRLHMLLFAAVAGIRALAPQEGGKISDFAAFAASCDIADTAAMPPMLTLTTAEDQTAILTAAEQALTQPPGKKQQQHYLEHLRQAGNGFSFSNYLVAWQQ